MMKYGCALLLAPLALAACGATPPPAEVPIGEEPVADPDGGFVYADPFVPEQPGDLAPCPGINPDIRRPAGSNCLGVTPDQCGADKVLHLVGSQGSDERRRFIAGHAVGDFRWVAADMAMTEDFNAGRLNVRLDESGTIIEIDCY